MQDAFAYCGELVRAADRDRYIATLFAPAERRGALHALYAFDVEIARVREAAREPLPGEIRLQWWCDVIKGERADEAAANPVAAALIAVIHRYELSRDGLTALLEAHRFDLYQEPMTTTPELEAYAVKTSSSVIAMAAQILGGPVDTDNVTRPIGLAAALVSLLVRYPRHAASRQIYVPADLLARHGVASEDVFAGTSTPGLRAALREMGDLAAAALATAGRHIAVTPPAIIPALLPAAVVRPRLARIKRSDYDPFAPSDILPLRRQWLIWRAARDAKRITG